MKFFLGYMKLYLLYKHELFRLLKSNIELCRSAAGKIDRLQADCIQSKSELIALQQNKLDTVQTSVRKEMHSWSDIVQKNCEKSSVLV